MTDIAARPDRNFPPARRIAVGEVALSVHLAGPERGPPIVLCHGWPELAYSWKAQIPALASAGYRVIAPDLRGFGGSDAPASVEAYRIDRLTADIKGLLDALEIERAIWCGHDWGGILVWHAAVLAPERISGVIGVNTPHLPRPPIDPIEALRAFGGDEHYIVRFQDQGVVEPQLEADVDAFFRFVFGPPPPPEALERLPASVTHLPKRFERFRLEGPKAQPVVGEADRAVFVEAYRRTGFAPGLNYYRNLSANWRLMEGRDYRLAMPCLMVSAECDIMLPPKMTKHMPGLIADLEAHVLPRIGHWSQWEAPDALNRLLLDWLGRRFPTRD